MSHTSDKATTDREDDVKDLARKEINNND